MIDCTLSAIELPETKIMFKIGKFNMSFVAAFRYKLAFAVGALYSIKIFNHVIVLFFISL